EMSRDSGGGGGGEVAVLVANQEAGRAIDRPRAQEVEDHARRGLAPIAGPAVGGDDPLRVEGAIADIVEVSPGNGKLAGEVGMQVANFRLALTPARDPGPTGYDEDEQPGIDDRLDR